MAIRDVESVLEEVHDRWFCIDEVKFDEASSTVAIPFRMSSKSEIIGMLNISGVRSLSVTDTEKVGFYDINTIEFDESRSELIVTGGVPILLKMKISRLEFEILSSSEPK